MQCDEILIELWKDKNCDYNKKHGNLFLLIRMNK